MTLTAPALGTHTDTADLEERLRPPPLPPVDEWREIRRAAGVTIDAVAAAVGVHVMTVSRWERGLNYPWRCHWEIYGRVLLALKRIAETRQATSSQK